MLCRAWWCCCCGPGLDGGFRGTGGPTGVRKLQGLPSNRFLPIPNCFAPPSPLYHPTCSALKCVTEMQGGIPPLSTWPELTPAVIWQRIAGAMPLPCSKSFLEQHASTPYMNGWHEAWVPGRGAGHLVGFPAAARLGWCACPHCRVKGTSCLSWVWALIAPL